MTHHEIYGTLYVVPTPIGNLEDMTFRAIRILKEVSLVAAEDTRQTKQLFHYFDISTPLVSYHEHNKHQRERMLIDYLKQGKSLALVSDAGMPAISDPGFEMVHAAIQASIKVVVLPGANAAICALVGSGLPTQNFYFYGFLPRKRKEVETVLKELQSIRGTLIFYESPYRLKGTLKLLHEQYKGRKIALAREISKRFEEYLRGTTDEMVDMLDDYEPRGEYCIVVEGNLEPESVAEDHLWWSHLSIEDHVKHYLEKKMKPNDAIKRVAVDRQMMKRNVYQIYHHGK